MEALKMIRSYLDNATLGKIHYNGHFVCYTVEKPWISNQPFTSCIPTGIYPISRHYSEKYPNTFALVNHDLGIGHYKGDSIRYSCLIHIANFPNDVQGCIGPGLELHPTVWGVSQSRKAMDVLNKLINLESEDWQLEIT